MIYRIHHIHCLTVLPEPLNPLVVDTLLASQNAVIFLEQITLSDNFAIGLEKVS
jgi:hypothetical protein